MAPLFGSEPHSGVRSVRAVSLDVARTGGAPEEAVPARVRPPLTVPGGPRGHGARAAGARVSAVASAGAGPAGGGERGGAISNVT